MFDLSQLIVSIPGLLAALMIHELAHGYMADYLGDPTPRAMGRLSWNPLAHLDPIGTLMLLFFRFGWAKPVPINPMYFKNRQKGMLLTGLAGPTVNLVMAAVSTYLLLQFWSLRGSVIFTVFNYFLLYNIWLGLFNLLPIPPLDGSHIARGLFRPGSLPWQLFHQIEQYGWVILMVLLVTGTISRILFPAANALQGFLIRLVSPLVL